MKLTDLPLDIRAAIENAISEIYRVTAEQDIEPTEMFEIVDRHLGPIRPIEATVAMEGGIVQDVEVPAGFAVRVRDFDTDGVDAARLIKSEDYRDPYTENVWGSTATPDPDRHEYQWNDKSYVGRDQLFAVIANELSACLAPGGLLRVTRDDGKEFEVALAAGIVPAEE